MRHRRWCLVSLAGFGLDRRVGGGRSFAFTGSLASALTFSLPSHYSLLDPVVGVHAPGPDGWLPLLRFGAGVAVSWCCSLLMFDMVFASGEMGLVFVIRFG